MIPQSENVTKKRLPTWAKLVIGLVLAAMISTSLLIFGMAVFFQKVAKEAQDPNALINCAREIANIETPLPPGYKFSMGFGMFGINTITVDHQPDNQMIILISYPSKGDENAQVLVDKLYDSGLNTPQASARFQEVKEKAQTTVGGENMPYIVGVMEDKSGTKFEGLVGCICSKKAQKSILVYGMQPPGAPYNKDVTMGFLKTIKGF